MRPWDFSVAITVLPTWLGGVATSKVARAMVLDSCMGMIPRMLAILCQGCELRWRRSPLNDERLLAQHEAMAKAMDYFQSFLDRLSQEST
jgi:hypothetical protein